MADAEAQIRALEQKYTRLLEARVADLEGKVANCSHTCGDKSPASTNPVPTPAGTVAGSEKSINTGNVPKTETRSGSDAKDAAKDDKKAGDAAGNETETSRYRVVINQLDSKTGEYKDTLSQKSEEDGKAGTAFTYRKRLRQKRQRDGEQVLKASGSEVEIHSRPLQAMLEKITRRYQEQGLVKVMHSPFRNFLYSWDAATEEAERTDFDSGSNQDEIKQARADLKELMKMISTSSGDEALDEYFKIRDTLRADNTITFDALWTLFPPGSLVVSTPFLEMPQVFFVQRSFVERRFQYYSETVTVTFYLIVYGYDWDGTCFNRVAFNFKIPEFPDRKEIFDLPIYPMAQHQSRDEGDKGADAVEKLKTTLVARGKKYRDYCIAERGKQTFQYKGQACYKAGSDLFGGSDEGDEDKPTDRWSRNANKKDMILKANVQGVVVVDFKSFLGYQSPTAPVLGEHQRYDKGRECSCAQCKVHRDGIFRYSWDNLVPDQAMTDEQYLLCPPRVLGYSMKEKKWMQFAVESLLEPNPADRNTFDNKLQLRSGYKELIWKSVLSHRKPNIADYTPGKGKGLIILLWGVPGVGKTLTAESVALLLGKPLFSVGVADIGLEGSKVETNLEKVFDLAGLWEAVLLFDEADVFLEARDRVPDIQRNTIVSVLLRSLEYFNGILFLTTNRPRSFDIAVQSRIHIAMRYDDLTADQRGAIFEEFLGQLRKIDLVNNWDDIMNWVHDEGREKTFNGRQIRNIVSTAMSLAHSENVTLGRQHLSQVSRNTQTFNDALAEQDAIYRNAQFQTRHYS